MPQSLHLMLGLCQRAGKIAAGDFAAEQSLKRHKGNLLLVAADASERTQEKFLNLAKTTGVTAYLVGTRDELGSALGKAHRAAVVIQSRDFAKGVVRILEKEGLTSVTGRG
jgi:ribosomal protein L7Ae-like RNA K-turn-binding protein